MTDELEKVAYFNALSVLFPAVGESNFGTISLVTLDIVVCNHSIVDPALDGAEVREVIALQID